MRDPLAATSTAIQVEDLKEPGAARARCGRLAGGYSRPETGETSRGRGGPDRLARARGRLVFRVNALFNGSARAFHRRAARAISPATRIGIVYLAI